MSVDLPPSSYTLQQDLLEVLQRHGLVVEDLRTPTDRRGRLHVRILARRAT